MNRTLIYARVSTDDQVEKYGLPVQLKVCGEYALAHGFQVVEGIVDEGVSGVVTDRPGLDRLRAMVRSRSIDIVLCVDSDRLSRDLGEMLNLKKELEAHARLEFVASRFDDSPSGRLFFNMRGAIAQHERELTRERTMRGQRERVSSGLLVGGRTPYGYRSEAGLLRIDPERAAAVRLIYEWYRAGLSIRAIADKLREDRIPTWSGKPWGHTSVRWILGSETYAGVAHWGTRRRDKGKLCPQPAARWCTLPVPALVDRASWEQVQAQLVANQDRSGCRSNHFLLSGLLACSCGRKMYGEFNKRRQYQVYRCGGRDRELGIACRRNAPGERLDTAVWEELRGTFGNAQVFRRVLQRAQCDLLQVPPDRAEHLRGQVARLKRREQAAMEVMLDPDLASDRARIKAQYKELQAQRVAAETDLARIAIAQEVSEPGAWVEETACMIHEYLGGVETVEKRQAFARRIVRRVEWDGSEALIRCMLSGVMTNTLQRTVQFPSLELILTARLAA
jgi:site-specific DNA recombinase